MKSIFPVTANEIKWMPHGPDYELHADDEVIATVRRNVSKPAGALVETADDTWTLERSGTVRKMVTIYRGGTDKFGMLLQRHGPQHRLLILDGTLYMWKPAYERGRHIWKFLDGQDQCLFFVHIGPDMPLTARVELVPCARNEPLLPLLLVLGWFELWMECEDATRPRAGAIN